MPFLTLALQKYGFFAVSAKKITKTFGRYKKSLYLCTRFRERNNATPSDAKLERALSSAGSEHLPYKQRVGGSNPSAPTKMAP